MARPEAGRTGASSQWTLLLLHGALCRQWEAAERMTAGRRPRSSRLCGGDELGEEVPKPGVPSGPRTPPLTIWVGLV